MTPSRVPSPAATGGAGVSFEARVGGITLSRLLRGDRVAGLGAPPARVRFQQLAAGAAFDDLVIEADDPRGGTRTVEYQVKRSLSVTASDTDFFGLVKRCVTELESHNAGSIDDEFRRFGVSSRPSAHMAQLGRIVAAARAQSTADDFFRVLQKSAAREVRERLATVRATVTKALSPESLDRDIDTMTWRVAKSIHVWQIDAEPDSGDISVVLDRLTDLLPPGSEPRAVFNELVAAAETWAPQAGSVDLPQLRTYLETRGHSLSDSPARRAAYETLQARSQRLLDPAAASLGRTLHLPREELRSAVRSAIEQHGTLVLSGRAGTGKSIAARLVARDLADRGAAAALIDLSGRSGSLSALEEDLGAPLARSLAGAPIGDLRVLFIDGGEQALTDGGALLSSVLNAVPVEPGSAPPWRIVLTSRDEAVPTLTRLVEDRTGTRPNDLHVGELNDDEVGRVVETFPHLSPLERNSRARSLLLRRPFLVELLVRADHLGLPNDLVGEEDVLNVVCQRLIRRDRGGLPGRGDPYARNDIFLRLGDAVIDNGLPARLDNTDSKAREGLLSDDILIEVRSSWQFSHDILADYAAATRLLEPDGHDRLKASPNPRRLLRASRLSLQREFADALLSDRFLEAWKRALQQAEELAAIDGPRWRDIPWEALLHLGAARSALDGLVGQLFANDAAQLVRLIDVTQRLGRLRRSDENEPPRLDNSLSAPVVDLLVTHAARVPATATLGAARLTHQHLIAARHDARHSDVEALSDVPDAVIQWAKGDQWGDRLEHSIGALAFCGEILQARHVQYLVGHAQTRPHEIAELVESPVAVSALATDRPELLLELAGLYYLGRGLRLDGKGEAAGDVPRGLGAGSLDDEDGVRGHSHEHSRHLSSFPLGNDQSNSALGPFAALLRANPEHGLRLVGAVVDAATIARGRNQARWSDPGSSPTDLMSSVRLSSSGWTRDLQFTGPAEVWMWHRRTTVGPPPALSALMALRAWGVAQIRYDGVQPRTVRDRVLGIGQSMAFVSVAVSVLVDQLDHVTNELDPFLVHPLLWRLENARARHEQSGPALEIPSANRLRWTFSDVAVHLVLRAETERRQGLKALGDRLVANHSELGDSDAHALARRWASELDAEKFEAKPQDRGVAISVNYPPDVVETLQTAGAAAQRSLRLATLLHKAVAVRDRKETSEVASALWTEAIASYQQQAEDGGEYSIYHPRDLLSAAASALIVASAEGHKTDETELRNAAEFLLDGAAHFGQSCPPAVENDEDNPDHRRTAIAGGSSSETDADHSIAAALPSLLTNAALRMRTGASVAAAADALEGIATSPNDQTRSRIVDLVAPFWDLPCETDERFHSAALRVARRMVATEGWGQVRPPHAYSAVMMPEPLEEAIRGSSGRSFDAAGASFGITLAAAARCECDDGVRAIRLVDAALDYDRRVWPTEFARKHFHRLALWRRSIDAVIAERVIAGDDEPLDAHLDAFAPIGEELAGFLEQLKGRAVDASTAERLHVVWPRILDRLLPSARDLGSGRRSGRGRPYPSDVENLDRALLLVPPDAKRDWPINQTLTLNLRWLHEYRATPHVVDRTIDFVGRVFGLKTDLAVKIVLDVLGDNLDALRGSSRYLPSWLEAVLTHAPSGEYAGRVRVLLDRLAAAGDEWALAIQERLEA